MRNVRFWSNPFYPIPGSPDFHRCRERGLLTDDTDYSVCDPYNFAIGSDTMSPEEIYWAWMAVQPASQWPDLVRELPSPGSATLEDAIVRLIYHSTCSDAPTVHGAALQTFREHQDGFLLFSRDEGCFCSDQYLAPGSHPDRSRGVCTLTGDLFSGALSLYCGRPVRVEEIECRLGENSTRCAFLARGVELPGAAWRYLEILRREIAAEMRARVSSSTAP
jgi:hypothetical protein